MLCQRDAFFSKVNFGEIDESKLEEVMESFRKSEADMERMKEKKEEKIWKTALKYFVHGVSFSVLFFILEFVWLFGLLILVSIGHFLGLIIGVVILIWIVGGLNALLTAWLWFPVKTTFWSLFFHGIILFLALVIVNGIFVYLPSLVVPGTITYIVTFIIGSFIDGYVAKKVAGVWKTSPKSIMKTVEMEWSERKL